jgi:hypothetical protein
MASILCSSVSEVAVVAVVAVVAKVVNVVIRAARGQLQVLPIEFILVHLILYQRTASPSCTNFFCKENVRVPEAQQQVVAILALVINLFRRPGAHWDVSG